MHVTCFIATLCLMHSRQRLRGIQSTYWSQLNKMAHVFNKTQDLIIYLLIFDYNYLFIKPKPSLSCFIFTCTSSSICTSSAGWSTIHPNQSMPENVWEEIPERNSNSTLLQGDHFTCVWDERIVNMLRCHTTWLMTRINCKAVTLPESRW